MEGAGWGGGGHGAAGGLWGDGKPGGACTQGGESTCALGDAREGVPRAGSGWGASRARGTPGQRPACVQRRRGVGTFMANSCSSRRLGHPSWGCVGWTGARLEQAQRLTDQRMPWEGGLGLAQGFRRKARGATQGIPNHQGPDRVGAAARGHSMCLMPPHKADHTPGCRGGLAAVCMSNEGLRQQNRANP